MKAWIIRDRECVAEWSTVVFAETRGKAIAAALCTDAFEDFYFTDIWALRVPELDQYYRGKYEMDWDDAADRVAMVRYAGMYCSMDMLPEDLGCKECPAKDWCIVWEDYKEEDGVNDR